MLRVFRSRRLRWTLVIFMGCLSLYACATSQTKPVTKATTTPALTLSLTPTLTPAASPYPTPAVWQRYTYPGNPSLFSVEYPFGWILSPLLANTENFQVGKSENLPDDLLVSINATVARGAIPGICPAHPTTMVAGLPAAEMTGYDAYNRPYHEWDAANQAIGLRFIVTFSLDTPNPTLQKLDTYVGVYAHMLASLTVPSQYTHAPACTAT